MGPLPGIIPTSGGLGVLSFHSSLVVLEALSSCSQLWRLGGLKLSFQPWRLGGVKLSFQPWRFGCVRLSFQPWSFGGTPLDVSDGEIAKLLRKHGGKTGAELIEASDALIRAARKGDIEAVKHAIAAGADVNAKNMLGETPLDYAVFWEESETADLLRKHGGKTAEELKAEGK